jgi:alkylated DNA repair protein (DNA oxidative demethylase)
MARERSAHVAGRNGASPSFRPPVTPPVSVRGFRFLPGYLNPVEQRALAHAVLARLTEAPLFTPVMPRTGRPFSVRMTNLGALGWVSDRLGYRYQTTHPATGRAWPAIPGELLRIWCNLAGSAHDPEACLVNFYDAGARMGLHQDRDELDFSAPIVSVSLGDAAVFRLGGRERGDPTRTFRLASGDVVVLGGESRLFFHGIDRIHAGTSDIVPGGGRINLTLRRVGRP